MSTMNETKPYTFINPYNFIPLFGRRAEGAKEKGTYTGVIDYSVLTKTPLFIPNTSNDNAFRIDAADHKSYDFFSYTDLSNCQEGIKESHYMPVIPGSEMRGMLRSYFEILTNSCMSAIDDTSTLSKRTNQAYSPGLIKKTGPNTYDLYSAEDCLMRTQGENSLDDDWAEDKEHYTRKCYVQEDLQEGRKVFFKYVKRKKGKSLARFVSPAKTEKQDRVGYVIKGEDGPQTGNKQQKHCCHIFTEKKLYRESISLSTLKLVLKEYKDNGEHPYEEYAEQFEIFEKGPDGAFFPVYYSDYSEDPAYRDREAGQHLMLSPACITREIYGRTLREMIGTHASCTDKDKLCPACTLFGTIGERFAHTSRIRVADLTCTKTEAKECYEQPVTLPPLSSPKLNNMEFYLKRPEGAWFWTYDYYIDNMGNVYENREGINGRKFYWHQMDVKLENQEASKLNMTIRPLKKNITFKGKLYFRNLSKTEMDQLIYLLNAGDEAELEEKTHGYKLGGGKPLGLGSIAVKVDRVTVRSYEKDDVNHTVERKESLYKKYCLPKFEENIVRDFEIMTDFNAVKGKNISYPLTGKPDKDGNLNIFDWFTQNHMAYRYNKNDHTNERISMPNSRKQMVYAEYMEPMTADLVSTGFLEHSVEVQRQQNNGHQNNAQQHNTYQNNTHQNNARYQSVSHNSKRAIEAIVTGFDSYGNVYVREIENPSKQGRIGANFLKGQNPKKGDTIKVSFYKTNDKGKGVYNIEI